MTNKIGARNKKAKNKAQILAKFIAGNWHFCPIDYEISVDECEGWNSEKCVNCICKNVDLIRGKDHD